VPFRNEIVLKLFVLEDCGFVVKKFFTIYKAVIVEVATQLNKSSGSGKIGESKWC
jgi:hypothetical protein